MKSHWPKKMPAGKYAKRWYTSRTKETIINDIKRGNLPGVQEPNGQWFVWVNADDTAAFGYNPPVEIKTAASELADGILAKFKKAG
jgi:hypothetical protein